MHMGEDPRRPLREWGGKGASAGAFVSRLCWSARAQSLWDLWETTERVSELSPTAPEK